MEERRRFPRINKSYMLSYSETSTPDQKYEITQLINISVGGMCFVTTKQLEVSTTIQIELKVPYLSNRVYLQGKVLGSREKVKDIIYVTRLQFDNLPPNAELLIKEIIDIAQKEK